MAATLPACSASTCFTAGASVPCIANLKGFAEAEEISTAGDSFLILFTKPSDAVNFALGLMAKLRAFNQGRAVK